MMTLADSGRIDASVVDAEIARLSDSWQDGAQQALAQGQMQDQMQGQVQAIPDPAVRAATDPFDLVQLDYVLSVCRRSKSQAEAGRTLFAVVCRIAAGQGQQQRQRPVGQVPRQIRPDLRGGEPVLA
ncbi:hypothetical protein [Cupriavidus basilensis]|uniref:Transcriptional regulatory protein RtcR n=1 Tax=Cupriavidus basilensis TaxID=68895 RepID=A0A0C4YNI3_9BURK|nr:hypothetical protein [Cupriavidus basilensis]AJG22116.1 Transcriptional regulatory protein RtcR [Cupriavidus basilensis]